MRFLNKNSIKLDKVINELDRFVFKFIDILEKHTDYVIVSGYTSILLGRNRATDDIDIIIPKIAKARLSQLYSELLKDGFWCLNSSLLDDLYEILISRHSIRFAVKPMVSPNIELKLSKDIYDGIALKKLLIIKIDDKELRVSSLELQIAYKEEVLKSNKDIEDARHLRIVAKEHLDNSLIRKYKVSMKRHEGRFSFA